MNIPFHKPFLPKNISKIFGNSIKNGWLTTGSVVNNFESDLKDYTNYENIIAVNSCTAALHLALSSKGFGLGDKFIAPTYTFVASVEVGEYLSMQPVLVDCNDYNFNLDLNIVEDLLAKDKSIKVIIPVHFAGEPVSRKELNFLSEKYNIFILEDAAHALESSSLSNTPKNINSAVAYSFYANKNITTGGEGGALATMDNTLAEKVRKLSLHGMSKDGWKRFKDSTKWGYDVSELGYKYNMTDISASFGLNQLSNINEWRKQRLKLVNIYSSQLESISGIIIPKTKSINHSWHLYIIQIKNEMWKISRNDIILKLNDAGVGTSVHYIPVHMHSYYKNKYGFIDAQYPNSYKYYQSVITLPLYPLLTEEQVLFVSNVLQSLWMKYKS
jgi:dTDP-4-amino-4,6-dideoxygalactose transaminase